MNKQRRMTKSLLTAGLGAICIVSSGCGKTIEEPVTLTVIHAWGGTGTDHVAMRDIYEDFQKQNPDIELQMLSMPAREEMLRKAEDMIMVGNMPDVVTFSGMGQNSTYDFIVENDMALDLMPYVEDDPDLASNISKANIAYWTTEDNSLYTIADVLSLSGGYWYNRDILHAAGIEELPETWDEFYTMCDKIQTWATEKGCDIKPHQTSPEGFLYFMDHMLQQDTAINEEDYKNEIGVQELREVMENLQRIYNYSGDENAQYSYLDETKLFNEGQLAIYVNGVWGAPMISDNIDAGYALIPTESGRSMSCESACLGYVLANSGNIQKEEASIRFLKYMLSEEVQTRILEETEQIPANAHVSWENYKEEKPRLYQAASLVLQAEQKTEVPDNLWSAAQKTYFTETIFAVLTGDVSVEEFIENL